MLYPPERISERTESIEAFMFTATWFTCKAPPRLKYSRRRSRALTLEKAALLCSEYEASIMKKPVATRLILITLNRRISITPDTHRHKPSPTPATDSARIALLRPQRRSSRARAARPPSRGSAGKRFTSVSERLKEAKSSAAIELTPNTPQSAFAQQAATILAAGPQSATASA